MIIQWSDDGRSWSMERLILLGYHGVMESPHIYEMTLLAAGLRSFPLALAPYEHSRLTALILTRTTIKEKVGGTALN